MGWNSDRGSEIFERELNRQTRHMRQDAYRQVTHGTNNAFRNLFDFISGGINAAVNGISGALGGQPSGDVRRRSETVDLKRSELLNPNDYTAESLKKRYGGALSHDERGHRTTPAPVEDHSFPSSSPKEISVKAESTPKNVDKNDADVQIFALVGEDQSVPVADTAIQDKPQTNFPTAVENVSTAHHYKAAQDMGPNTLTPQMNAAAQGNSFFDQVQRNMGLTTTAPAGLDTAAFASNDAQYKQVANAPSLIPGH